MPVLQLPRRASRAASPLRPPVKFIGRYQIATIRGNVAAMKSKRLTEVLERVEAWPAGAQDELAAIALDIDANLKDAEYEPTPTELEGIDRGLRDAAEGRFATDEQIEAVFAKFRRR
jgi:hypothetical protein